jgi:hypothetical protein
MAAAISKSHGYLRGLLKGLVTLTWLTAFILLFVFGWQLWNAVDVWVNKPSFDINASSIALTGLPGKTVAFRLTGASVGGKWASSTGLSLNLSGDRPGFTKTFAIAPAKHRNWGNRISVCVPSCGDGGYTIYAQFALPGYLGKSPDRTLSGTLSGELYYPRESGDASFKNVDARLRIPVTLTLGGSGLHRKLAISFFGILVTLLVMGFTAAAARRFL